MEGRKGNELKYTSEHFINRLKTLQVFCASNKLDAILMIMGVDGGFDKGMRSLVSWLFCGAYGLQTGEDTTVFDECIFAVAPDALYVYCGREARLILEPLLAQANNVHMHCLSKRDKADLSKAEIVKIGQFYKMIYDKPVIGIPLAEPEKDSDFYFDRHSEKYIMKVVENWPLIQAYGLESVGGGFFTIIHKLENIREKLRHLYSVHDSYTLGNLLMITIPQMENSWNQCFGILARSNLGKRLEFTEADLAAELFLPYEFGFMSFESTDIKEHRRKDGLPLPRVLVGKNTNEN